MGSEQDENLAEWTKPTASNSGIQALSRELSREREQGSSLVLGSKLYSPMVHSQFRDLEARKL